MASSDCENNNNTQSAGVRQYAKEVVDGRRSRSGEIQGQQRGWV